MMRPKPSVEILGVSGNRLDFLDALRGIAAVMVFLVHLRAKLFFFQTPLPGWLDQWVAMGHTGVLLFFILSAFSLCLTMPRHERTGAVLTSFYLHRIFRIMPLFYAMILISILRNVYLFNSSGINCTEILLSVFGLNNFYLPSPVGRPVWAGWTISVEMIFYAIFPLLFSRLASVGRAATAVLSSVLLFVAIRWLFIATGLQILYPNYIFWSIFRYLPIFFMGFLVFYIAQSPWFLRWKTPLTGGVCIMLALVVMYVFSRNILVQHPGFVTNYYPLGVGYMLLVLGLYCWPMKFVVNKCTKFLGKLSFSIYLIHPIIIYFLKRPVYAFFEDTGSDTVTYFFTFITLLIITTGISWLTFALIESPGIRAGKRMVAWLVSRRSAPVVSLESNVLRTSE